MLLSEYVAAVEARAVRDGKPILDGAAKSYEDYKERCGYLKGLREAVQILRDLVEQTPKEERDL